MGWLQRYRRRRQRGAVLVELTLAMPFLVFLTMGMLEMGLAWQAKQTVTQASRQGARVVAQYGTDVRADREALWAALSVLDDDQRANINYVVVYRATAGGDLPNASCRTASVANQCNRYSPAMLTDASLSHDGNWGGGTGRHDRPFRPALRSTNLLGAGPDRIGVLISFDHDWFTGFLPGSGIPVEARTIMQLEPVL